MSIADIGTYLSDHLAGSTAAVQLLQHLKSINKDGGREKFLIRICGEIEADQSSLQEIMTRLHVLPGTAKSTVSWLAEKAARLKLWIESTDSPLFWLESFEVLSLGIEGKLGLWKALIGAPIGTEIGIATLEDLKRRATSQRGRVEKLRMAAAKEALCKAT